VQFHWRHVIIGPSLCYSVELSPFCPLAQVNFQDRYARRRSRAWSPAISEDVFSALRFPLPQHFRAQIMMSGPGQRSDGQSTSTQGRNVFPHSAHYDSRLKIPVRERLPDIWRVYGENNKNIQ
jgi:hypothetical protein